MPPHTAASAADRVVRISLLWIIIGVVAIVILSITGGVVAQQFFRSPLPLIRDPNQIVSTVQEVTISPNTAAAALIDRTNRSIVLLGRQEIPAPVIIGTGVVLTNDGIVATTIDVSGELVAYDHEGRALPVEKVGNDILFGLSYYRITSNVVVPLDVRQGDAPIGQELLMLSRSAKTFLPRTKKILITEYVLPPANTPPGMQRILLGTPLAGEESASGSPLLDEEGRIAGLLRNPAQGLAIPVSHLAASVARLTNNQRELDTFATTGLEVTYRFASLRPGDAARFTAEVIAVVPNSPAAIAGVERGDLLLAVGENTLDWQRPIASQLASPFPLRLQVMRKDAEQTFTLQAQPSPLAP